MNCINFFLLNKLFTSGKVLLFLVSDLKNLPKAPPL